LYNVFKRETFFETVGQQYLANHFDQSMDHEVLSEVDQNERKQIVTKLLNRLTDRQREAIYYRFIEELSMEEISILMEMNTQSVQNIIQRSLKKLRESTSYLNQYFEKYLIKSELLY
jgi:RNA polymerase sigma factor (sigma-70 family)